MGKIRKNRPKKPSKDAMVFFSTGHDQLHEMKQKHGAMFKKRDNPEDVIVLFDKIEYIYDVNKLNDLDISRKGLVSAKENECAYDHSIKLIDLKLKVRGPKEDEAFTYDGCLYKNLRRGNTLVLYNKTGVAGQKLVIGRKGLNKFFDLDLDFLEPSNRYKDSSLSACQYAIKNYQLAAPLKAMIEGHSIEIIKTLKANGENAQVSYLKDLDAWIVASKNTGLLIRTRDDIEKYPQSMYSFAMEMSLVWIDFIDQLKLQPDGVKYLKELKDIMNGRTLVGEYVGAQEHQHMVKYDQVTLMFYAIVDNNSPDICWPPDKALEVFQKFGLHAVRMQSLGQFNNYDKFIDKLYQTFQDVASSKINEDEEGSVLYFVKRDKDGIDQNDKVLSLCKLKTLEYRAFRKMREKLRNYVKRDLNNKVAEESLIKKFAKEMKEVSYGNDLPQPMEFYTDLFKLAFVYIRQFPDKVQLLNEEYITFQEHLLKYKAKLDKHDEIDKNMFRARTIGEEQPYLRYGLSFQEDIFVQQPIPKSQKYETFSYRYLLLCPQGILTNGNILEQLMEEFHYDCRDQPDLQFLSKVKQQKNKPYLMHAFHLKSENVQEIVNILESYKNIHEQSSPKLINLNEPSIDAQKLLAKIINFKNQEHKVQEYEEEKLIVGQCNNAGEEDSYREEPTPSFTNNFSFQDSTDWPWKDSKSSQDHSFQTANDTMYQSFQQQNSDEEEEKKQGDDWRIPQSKKSNQSKVNSTANDQKSSQIETRSMMKKRIQVQKQQKFPLFLGIDLQADKKCNFKIENMLSEAEQIINEKLSEVSTFRDYSLANFFNEAKKSKSTNVFTLPQTFHVTQLFIGSHPSEEIIHSDIYKNFKEDQKVIVQFRGLLVVKDRIVVGLGFIGQKGVGIQNEFPHLTIMFNSQSHSPERWKPFDSNLVLEQTCSDETQEGRRKGVFHDLYQKMQKIKFDKPSQKDSEVQEVIQITIKGEKCEACMILFQEPIEIEGKTKKYH
eukprot:403338791